MFTNTLRPAPFSPWSRSNSNKYRLSPQFHPISCSSFHALHFWSPLPQVPCHYYHLPPSITDAHRCAMRCIQDSQLGVQINWLTAAQPSPTQFYRTGKSPGRCNRNLLPEKWVNKGVGNEFLLPLPSSSSTAPHPFNGKCNLCTSIWKEMHAHTHKHPHNANSHDINRYKIEPFYTFKA